MTRITVFVKNYLLHLNSMLFISETDKDESKTSTSSSGFVSHNDCVFNFTKFLEIAHQLWLCGTECKTSNKEFNLILFSWLVELSSWWNHIRKAHARHTQQTHGIEAGYACKTLHALKWAHASHVHVRVKTEETCWVVLEESHHLDLLLHLVYERHAVAIKHGQCVVCSILGLGLLNLKNGEVRDVSFENVDASACT